MVRDAARRERRLRSKRGTPHGDISPIREVFMADREFDPRQTKELFAEEEEGRRNE